MRLGNESAPAGSKMALSSPASAARRRERSAGKWRALHAYRLAFLAFEEMFGPEEILKWLRIFCRRFFAQQFKRNCLPDGPKVGSVSLSPRGDWRMPSDACAALWLQELEEL